MKKYLLLLLAALCFAPCARAEQAPKALPLPTIGHPYQLVDSVVAGLPSGTNLDQGALKPLLGPDAAAYIDLLKVDRVISTDSGITISLSAPYDGKTAKGTRVQVAGAVTFTSSKDSSGTVIFDKVSGIKVKPLWILGWMPVKQITIASDTAGNTTFTVILDTIIGQVKHSIKLGPDGKPLP